MDLNTLQAFVEVADQGSFSAAADSLYLTQPAVSKRVAQLESELNVALFDRIGRKITPTEAGRALIPKARRLLNDARDLKQVLADLSGDVGGTLVMGTSHHIGLHRLPGPLKEFTQNFPDVELDIRFMDSEEACHAVELGDLELAIVTLPPKPMNNLRLESIWHDPLNFMVGLDHPLCNQGSSHLDSLLEYPAVLPGHSTYTRGILERAVTTAGRSLKVAMASNYLETLRMLVAAGLGWSLLPASVLDESIVPIEVEELSGLSRELGVVTHEKRSLSNAGKAMIEVCKTQS